MATSRNNFGTYVPVEAVDWGKAIGGLYDTVKTIGETREKERDQLDKLMNDAILDINNSEALKTQSLQDYITDGAYNGKNTLRTANQRLKNGEITPKEYKAIVNNVNTYWSTMANTMKNFDATNQEMLKRLQPGEDGSEPVGSEIEEALALHYASQGDIRNTKFIFNPDSGEGYSMKIDPNTGQPLTITNSTVFANPRNIMDNRFDFDSDITNYVKGFRDVSLNESGMITTKDPLAREDVARAVTAKITSLTNSPRMSAQILARYGGYNFYFSDSEKEKIIQDAINEENKALAIQGKPPMTDNETINFIKNSADKLILVSLNDNNEYQPNISLEQQRDAETLIEDQIKSKIQKARTEDEPSRGSGSGSGSGRGSGDLKLNKDALYQVKELNKILANAKTAERELNNRYSGKGLTFDWNGKEKEWFVYQTSGKRDKSTGKFLDNPKYRLRWDVSAFNEIEGYANKSSSDWSEAIKSLNK